MVSPTSRRDAARYICERWRVSERRACDLANLRRSTYRYKARPPKPENLLLIERMKELAVEHPAWGYKKIAHLLRESGWQVNNKRVRRLWREAGLKVRRRKRRRKRAHGSSVSSIMQLAAERPHHVWTYDFITDRTRDGRAIKMLVVVDEFTRRCLTITARRDFKAEHVVHELQRLMAIHGVPAHLRSDNGPEFIAQEVRLWLHGKTRAEYIEPGSPWQNAYIETFNDKLRAEFLNREIFHSLREAQVLLEQWRILYNEVRPHASLGYDTPDAYAKRQERLPAGAA